MTPPRPGRLSVIDIATELCEYGDLSGKTIEQVVNYLGVNPELVAEIRDLGIEDALRISQWNELKELK